MVPGLEHGGPQAERILLRQGGFLVALGIAGIQKGKVPGFKPQAERHIIYCIVTARRIGIHTAEAAKGLGMHVIAYNRSQSQAAKDLGVEFVDLDGLFARSDVLALQMPLADFNVGIINKENIAKMKDGVIILNNSRGQMVVEQDLADALNSGKVAYAGLDVVSTEPIRADNPLLTAKNCIITPHMSWGSQGSRQRIMDCTVNNIRAFLSGAPENVVNP